MAFQKPELLSLNICNVIWCFFHVWKPGIQNIPFLAGLEKNKLIIIKFLIYAVRLIKYPPMYFLQLLNPFDVTTGKNIWVHYLENHIWAPEAGALSLSLIQGQEAGAREESPGWVKYAGSGPEEGWKSVVALLPHLHIPNNSTVSKSSSSKLQIPLFNYLNSARNNSRKHFRQWNVKRFLLVMVPVSLKFMDNLILFSSLTGYL